MFIEKRTKRVNIEVSIYIEIHFIEIYFFLQKLQYIIIACVRVYVGNKYPSDFNCILVVELLLSFALSRTAFFCKKVIFIPSTSTPHELHTIVGYLIKAPSSDRVIARSHFQWLVT